MLTPIFWALGLGQDVVDERRLAGGLRAEDLDDAAAGHAADAQREVQRQRAGRDRVDLDLGAFVAHAHDRPLAELALDLGQGAGKGGVAGLDGLLVGGGHLEVRPLSAAELGLSVRNPSDGTEPYGCSCAGSAPGRHESADSAPRSSAS
jgi:hypothetical protein